MRKTFLGSLCCLLWAWSLQGQNLDVQHYNLQLTIRNLQQKNLQGIATIRYQLQQTADSIFFELNKLSVDSVLYHAQKLNYHQRGDSVWILFPGAMAPGLDSLQIHYSGEPGKDPLNLGGFYFQDSTVAFNIGVSFVNDPHNFGKAWFPCRDNFQDKATFQYHIRVDSGMTAVCGGLLYQIDTLSDNSLVYHWNLSTPISTYLASVAVGRYYAIRDTVHSLNNNVIPIELYGLSSDTTLIPGTFANLKTAFHIMESLWGPFQFERIGYVIVPFSAGAMEHACNIAFPKLLLTGTNYADNIMAHELSHSWFGNLVTCNTQENMWLNEGWASYCEPLFFEHFQNPKAYRDYVRGLHEDVLRRAHILDGSYLPLTPMPAAHTYGTTVYKKGAITLHTLRNYLGDSLFFPSARHYLNKHAFSHASTDDFQLALEEHSLQNLNDFFDGWVRSPGFAHFSADSFSVNPLANGFETHIFLRQRLKQKPQWVRAKVPVALWSQDWQRKDTLLWMHTEYDTLVVYTSFQPVMVMVDPEETLADATVDEYRTTKTIATLAFDKSYGNVSVTQIPSGDSALVRFIHHFIAPEGNQPEKGIYLGGRYWEIQMLSPDSGFQAKAVFRYNGSTSGTTAYLDTDWWNTHEDSLVLLYKEKMGQPWQIWDSTLHQKGNPNDKIGYFEARNLKSGYYAIGYRDTVQTVAKASPHSFFLNLYPNPTKNLIHLKTNLPLSNARIEIHNLMGQKVLEMPYQPALSLPLPAGTYLLTLKNNLHAITQKLIITP